MDFQPRPTDLPTPDLGMDLGWQPDVYNKFIGNSHYALDTPSANMPDMSKQFDFKPKSVCPLSVHYI